LSAGSVKPHKGVNIPSISHFLGFLTEKDLRDLAFISRQEIDFLAVSFVSSGKDIINLRRILKELSAKEEKKQQALFNKSKPAGKKQASSLPWIVAKIEREEAIENLKEIIKEADAIMVARGDLAVELPQEKVAILQKEIIKKCLKAKKPVIVATQMMASMITKPRPTRAEISDITNAVIDHADAVMFSNETAVGAYPKEVIQTTVKIIKETEQSPWDDFPFKNAIRRVTKTILNRHRFSDRKKKISIKTLEEALTLAAFRQEQWQIKLSTRDPSQRRRVSLLWGVE
jgi:pyruvate kinase